MDRRTLTRDEALELVRRYKRVISARFDVEPKVMMFGSYSKGYANPDSDIDVAVIVPTYGGSKFELSFLLCGVSSMTAPSGQPTYITHNHFNSI